MSAETKHCPFCAEPIQAAANVCRYCGHDLVTGQPVASQTAPAQEKKKGEEKRTAWIIIAVLILAVMCLCCLFSATADNEGGLADLAKRALATPVPGRVIAPPFSEIDSTVASMTEAQWKPYLAGLKGQWVADWTGWIVDVDSKLSGQYVAWVDMDAPGTLLSIQDVYVPVGESLALQLQKGTKVTFSGQIATAIEFLGSVSIQLEDAALAISK